MAVISARRVMDPRTGAFGIRLCRAYPVIGLAASRAIPDAMRTVSSFAGLPTMAAPASSTNSGVGATDASVTRAADMSPLSRNYGYAGPGYRNVHLVARDEPDVVRAGVGRRRGEAHGDEQFARFQHGLAHERARSLLSAPRGWRRPAPRCSPRRRRRSWPGTESAEGAALHRFPPSEARPCICVPPMMFAASTMPGYTLRTVELP